MKRLLFFLIITLCSSQHIFAQLFWKSEETFEKDIIIVEGESINQVPADYATFDFSVKGVGKSLQLAVIDARDKISIITERLKAVGLKEENFATTFFQSGENYDDKAFLSSKRDFATLIKVVIGLDSLNLLEPAILAVSSSAPDEMSDIKFELRNIEHHKQIALKTAAKRAREKAEIISNEFNIKIGKAIYIEELSDKTVSYQTNSISIVAERMQQTTSQKGFYIESIDVKAKVRVIFQTLTNEM